LSFKLRIELLKIKINCGTWAWGVQRAQDPPPSKLKKKKKKIEKQNKTKNT